MSLPNQLRKLTGFFYWEVYPLTLSKLIKVCFSSTKKAQGPGQSVERNSAQEVNVLNQQHPISPDSEEVLVAERLHNPQD